MKLQSKQFKQNQKQFFFNFIQKKKNIFTEFLLIYIHKTALYMAVENGNIEIVKLLLSYVSTDPNIIYILKY